MVGLALRGLLIAAGFALAPACPSNSPDAAEATHASPGDAVAAVDVAALAEPWATHVATISDSARPHADRWQAVLALADAPVDVVEPLAAVGEAAEPRYYAVRALGEAGHPQAVEVLAGWLADRTWGQRRYAALALGQIGGGADASIAALEGALDDVEPVREEALLALTRLDASVGPALARFWTDGRSTGLEIAVAVEGDAVAPGAPARLRVTLSNRTDHPLILPPLASVLSRGLYLLDGGGRSAYPRSDAEDGRRAPDLQEIELAPGASQSVDLRVELIRWDRGVAIDHEWRPAPPTWALAIGSVRYLLHRDGAAPAGPWTAQLVWHPLFASDLAAQAARKDAFWTGKAASQPFVLTLHTPESP